MIELTREAQELAFRELMATLGARKVEPAPGPEPEPEPEGRAPFYPTLLHLQNVHPNAWQRAVLGEGMAALGVLLAMADLASAWAILVLPVAMGGVVKAHDLIAGVITRPASQEPAMVVSLGEQCYELTPEQLARLTAL